MGDSLEHSRPMVGAMEQFVGVSQRSLDVVQRPLAHRQDALKLPEDLMQVLGRKEECRGDHQQARADDGEEDQEGQIVWHPTLFRQPGYPVARHLSLVARHPILFLYGRRITGDGSRPGGPVALRGPITRGLPLSRMSNVSYKRFSMFVDGLSVPNIGWKRQGDGKFFGRERMAVEGFEPPTRGL